MRLVRVSAIVFSQLDGNQDAHVVGSGCSTAHAVMKQNAEDGGNRRFIMVQLPEPVDSPAGKTVADIGRTRIRVSGEKLASEMDETLFEDGQDPPDLGFRSLKLAASNFKIWDGTEPNATDLEKQLHLFADHVLPDRSEQAVLYELMLKAGLPLTAAIDEKAANGQKIYSIAEGLLAICLGNPVSQECLRGIIELGPQRVICLDAAFGGNDQLKTNTVLEMKSHGIEFRTV